MTAWLLSVVIAAATPSPLPPTILHERVSPVCSTLHQLVIPLAQMNIKNRALTDQIKSNYLEIQKYRNTKLGDGVFLRLAQSDMIATNMLANIADMETQLVKSYRAYPQGKNAKVDALRQRVQNVVDIERLIANNYSAAYGAAVDNDGVTGIENSLNKMVGAPNLNPQASPTPFPTDLTPPSLPEIPNDAQPKPASVADNDPKLASSAPANLRMRTLKWSALWELKDLLHHEGPALEAQALIAAHDCDGV
ncbi:MAG TPA: hypothetical protein VFO29_10410 [Candidatus Rubrimentiphilum sp.]|nr:hypothetical protein [Candidatus Rubrimentiphilum sp.]